MKIRHYLKKSMFVAVLVAVIVMPAGAFAGTIKIAVAANFENAMNALITAYNNTAQGASTTIVPTYDSSGNLVTAIDTNGNPDNYVLFLSADATRAPALVDKGIGTATKEYAIGQLAVYSKTKDFTNMTTDQVTAWLKTAEFTSGAVADPALAPYGVAAKQYLTAIGLWPSSKIDATYTSVGKAFNAANSTPPDKQVGFVANSQTKGSSATGTAAVIERVHDGVTYYDKIVQSGCLIKVNGATNPEAASFWNWISSTSAGDIIQIWGYELP